MIHAFAENGGVESISSRLHLRRRLSAFSLVEVVLALGIVSFAMLAMVSLIPTGIQSSRDSLEESGAINVLSALIADREATTNVEASSMLYGIAPLNIASSNSFGVTSANTNSANFGQSIYRVTCVITPPAGGRIDPYLAYFKVSWPASAMSSSVAGYVEQVVTIAQP